MKTQIIAVTQADIDKANTIRKAKSVYLSSQSCPIAQALKRQFPDACDVLASYEQIAAAASTPYEPDQFWTKPTERIRRFMRRWDRTWQAVPTRFRVTVR